MFKPPVANGNINNQSHSVYRQEGALYYLVANMAMSCYREHHRKGVPWFFCHSDL